MFEQCQNCGPVGIGGIIGVVISRLISGRIGGRIGVTIKGIIVVTIKGIIVVTSIRELKSEKMHLLYDDQCQFCCAIARWAKAQNAEIEVWSVRSTESKELLKTHGIHFIDLQTVYFVEGAVYVRSRAAFQMLRHTHRPWRWLALFRFLPLSLTDFVYNLIAKNRYRWN